MSKKVTMKAKKVANVKKNVASAKKAVAKVIKKQVAARKVVAKKVTKTEQYKINFLKHVAAQQRILADKKKAIAKKKVVAKRQTKAVAKKIIAKKQTKKEAIKTKIANMYSIVANYSENLMQDVYSVVYRTKELKRFINTNLANKYIEQEVLIRLNEHAISTAKKSRAVSKELASEFE
jgi:hypothetical protein